MFCMQNRIRGIRQCISDEEGGNLYLINGAMTKLADAGIFAGGEQSEEQGSKNSRKRGK